MNARIERLTAGVTLYLGDCREILPALGEVDAVVTDPPYGLGDLWKGGSAASASKWRLQDGGAEVEWDARAPENVLEIAGLAPRVIIWGGNYFALPPMRGWLVWDKKQTDKFSSGSAELAWTNLDQPIRQFRLSQVEAYCEPHASTKEHPTQKPLLLMKWCLGFLPDARSILDPFMGSGTTGVAAVNLGRKFIGIEIEPKYFDIGCRRIADALARPSLFDEKPEPPKQEQSGFKL